MEDVTNICNSVLDTTEYEPDGTGPHLFTEFPGAPHIIISPVTVSPIAQLCRIGIILDSSGITPRVTGLK